MEVTDSIPVSCNPFLSAMEPLSRLSSLSSHPLFCSIISLYSLILLYFPHLFLTIVFSPVLILTGTLLLTLLRLGAAQTTRIECNENRAEAEECDSGNEDRDSVTNETETDSEPETSFEQSFVEWNVRAPLEVIYEECEEGEDPNRENPAQSVADRERYPSLSLYYPDSDSDSSSGGGSPAFGGWDSPENICFRWDEEDREELIEIALDGKKRDFNKNMNGFQFDEENLIEIDISPTRIDELSGEKW